MAIKRVAVFCGANTGNDPLYTQAAQALADVLAARDIDLVYGAGSVGLMGVIADRMLHHGKQVIGVIPQHLMDMEVGHTGISDLRVVQTMHERKMMMAELADAFVAMPGGLGTLEEIIEVCTWNQLGIHQKAAGFLNVGGYYDQLFAFLDHAVAAAFLKPVHRESLLVDDSPARLLEQLDNYQGGYAPKWVARD